MWGNACDTHINAIQLLQNRVVHLITYNDDFPLIPGPLPASNPIFYKLELLKIKELFILMSCIFIYKCLNTSLLPLFEGWFKYSSSIHVYKTRSNYNIKSEVSTNNLFIPIVGVGGMRGHSGHPDYISVTLTPHTRSQFIKYNPIYMVAAFLSIKQSSYSPCVTLGSQAKTDLLQHMTT